MARTATARKRPARRSVPAKRGRISRPPRRAPRQPRPPLLSPDQRREITGVAAIGTGVLAGAVLILPGGGAVAGPLHDWLYGALGVGAWLAVLALLVTGVRLCASSEWRAGGLTATGSLLAGLTVLGLVGLASPDSAGAVGRFIGPGLAGWLGRAGAAAVLLAAAVIGTVLATELRVGPLLRAAAGWMQARQEERADARLLEEVRFQRVPAPAQVDAAAPRALAAPPVAELAGVPLLRGKRPKPEPDSPPVAFPPPIPLDEAPPQESPEIAAPFSRDFEGVAEPAGLGAVPQVTAGHAGDSTADEPEKVWVLPAIELLDTITGKHERLAAEVRVTGDKIVSTLQSFGIETRIIGASSGPTVTQYELQPAVGVPVRKIMGSQTDLALALAAPLRIQPFIPGKSAIGIEVPNKAAQLVSLKEIVEAPPFGERRNRLSVALGADVSGHPVVGDLTRMPHMLIAGATGSGKSVCINAVLGGFLLQATPAELKLILIDPKRVELSNFADLPHLLVPVVVEPESAVAALRWAVKEMEERYKLFASHGARNIAAFNERAPGLGLGPLPYVVIVVDELADLMMVAAGEIEDLICRIAQLARAVGIHLIVATQRPSADIITGLIKANIPSRIAFAVSSGVDSRVILDEMGAEKLLGRGDMLYLPIDEGKPRRLQGAFVSDRELDSLIAHWKAQGMPEYQEEIFTVEATVSWAREATKRDPLFAKAAHTVAAEGRAAASLLQRKLNVGYTRAARLVDQLAEAHVVGPFEGSKSREVLMDVFQVDELLAELDEE